MPFFGPQLYTHTIQSVLIYFFTMTTFKIIILYIPNHLNYEIKKKNTFYFRQEPPPPTTVLWHCPAFKLHDSYYLSWHQCTTLPTPRFFSSAISSQKTRFYLITIHYIINIINYQYSIGKYCIQTEGLILILQAKHATGKYKYFIQYSKINIRRHSLHEY